ncbi:restriction endonuclease subunit S [Escherichia marmotae]|uniref:restriction endonuclease subunit S n=1 Tax=Escherichia marmotae TaxID=1499973 RepID=UPI001C9A9087|nr:restriction endonuclease subunit S [Escherichia marmotae]MBY7377051.1 restriction endonuclease subunit S [Escherichia marmotae]
MSELSYLEKLLDGVEVEWRNLGDTSLFEIANNGRKPVKASLRIAGETPYYGANNIQDYVDGYTHDGEYVLIAEDGSASLENYSIQYATGKFWANNHVHVVRGKERVHSRFLYHYLCIVNFLPFLTGGGRAKLTKGQLIEIPVPIPCPDNPEKSLAIQSEIVRILDTFTALTAELTAELNMRKKQYNYYRDQLLSFDEEQEKPIYLEKLLDGVEVEWLPLSDLARIRNGKDHKSLSEGEFPVYGSGGIMRYVDTYAYNKPSVLIPRKGSLGNLFFIDVPFWTVDTIFYTEIDEAQIRPKYLYYFLSTVGLGEMNQAGGVPSQTQSVLNKLKIPIPCPDNPEKSLAIQSEIVRILDKFDTLTNSITEGLPREIELRQKQYEYYRDLLLSFPKPETVSN